MSTDETNDSETPGEADSQAAPGDEGEPQGVFGNLPTTRPGARSPRRAAEPGAAPRGERPAPATPEPAAGGGVEDVAWAGVAAAAEAATIGVRLATRALEAMRDAVDRR